MGAIEMVVVVWGVVAVRRSMIELYQVKIFRISIFPVIL